MIRKIKIVLSAAAIAAILYCIPDAANALHYASTGDVSKFELIHVRCPSTGHLASVEREQFVWRCDGCKSRHSVYHTKWADGHTLLYPVSE